MACFCFSASLLQAMITRQPLEANKTEVANPIPKEISNENTVVQMSAKFDLITIKPFLHFTKPDQNLTKSKLFHFSLNI